MLALALAVPLALGACTGDDGTTSPTSGASTGASTGANPTVTASPATSQPAGAFQALTKVACTRGSAGWSFTATLTNGDPATTTFTVSVAIAKATGGTVVGSTEITKTLEPGKSAALSAKDFYTGKETDVQCVPSATKAAA